jgi:Holliday junction DNA helicase RuvA
MIGRLTGRFEESGAGDAIIDVGGVGYVIQYSARTGATMTPGVTVTVLVETHIREDAMTLYAFADAEERRWFRLLTGVQGVGAKAALAVLSVVEPLDLAMAIAAADRGVISRANGVGPKLAGRIVSELKDKVGAIAEDARMLASSGMAPSVGSAQTDAVSAIVNLGFRPADALAAVNRVAARLGDEVSVEDLIRLALTDLAPAEGRM